MKEENDTEPDENMKGFLMMSKEDQVKKDDMISNLRDTFSFANKMIE